MSQRSLQRIRRWSFEQDLQGIRAAVNWAGIEL